MLEATVEVLKFPLVVLGISGILMALGTFVFEWSRYPGDSAHTDAKDSSKHDSERER